MIRISYITRLLMAVILLLPVSLAWSQDDDLLDPNRTFALQEPVIAADKITANNKPINPRGKLFKIK